MEDAKNNFLKKYLVFNENCLLKFQFSGKKKKKKKKKNFSYFFADLCPALGSSS